MGLFDKFTPFIEAREQLHLAGVDPFSVCMDKMISPTEALVNGRPTILAGTNNYLGLTQHPESIAAAHEALDEMGTGTTGSRVANGTYAGHQELERALAEFFGARSAIVFSTGYQANLGIISALAGARDCILIDADCHSSIYDGCRLSAATVVRFRHNDVADLDRRLTLLADRDFEATLILVEGIYSMLGDRAPLAGIVAVKERHGAYLLIDEAHSLGVLGQTGRGLAEELDLGDKVDFIVGTFSKSVGTVGGFCVSNQPRFDILRLVSRPYVFSASLPPSVVASAIQSLAKIRRAPELRRRLWQNAARVSTALAGAGFELGATDSPIISVILDGQDVLLRFWHGLLENGIYVNLALPPATPRGLFLLRCSISAAHTPEQIDAMIAVFEKLGGELGVLDSDASVASA